MIPLLTTDQIINRLTHRRPQVENADNSLAAQRAYYSDYLGMYSSWFGGMIIDPAFMMIPIDDHIVHRGDGVFEALRWSHHSLYNFEGHIARLKNSAGAIGLELPFSVAEIKNICLELLQVSLATEALVRIYVSRGPGGFSVDPRESVSPQLYIVASRFNSQTLRNKYRLGCRAMTSQWPAKPEPFAAIKSCNYLINVLMKKEAIEKNVDFTISIDDDGYVCEGATENIFMINDASELLLPNHGRILEGTTMARIAHLATQLVTEGLLSRIGRANIMVSQLLAAREVMIASSGLDLISVVEYDGHLIGGGSPGPLAARLYEFLTNDMAQKSSTSSSTLTSSTSSDS